MTYTSPITHNDLIKYYWRYKRSPSFSVLTDEVSSHNVEHLFLCFWFVDGHFLIILID